MPNPTDILDYLSISSCFGREKKQSVLKILLIYPFISKKTPPFRVMFLKGTVRKMLLSSEDPWFLMKSIPPVSCPPSD